MSQLRLEVPAEWLTEEFREATGFDADKILGELAQVVGNFKMPNPAGRTGKPPDIEGYVRAHGIPSVAKLKQMKESPPDIPKTVPFGNLSKLKHAIIPLHGAGVGGDPKKKFLHAWLNAGNDIEGRTDQVRSDMAYAMGDKLDELIAALGNFKERFNLVSITTEVGLLLTETDCYTTDVKRAERRAAADAPGEPEA